jgi:ATP-dependent helicase/nuclease subunit A
MRIIRWITASAGTGKTTKIMSIINNLVETGTDPSSILCLSFSNSASEEMKYRYQTLSKEKLPKFETIHSFANYLLSNKYKIIDEDEAENLIREAIELSVNDRWMDFFESIDYEWTNIIDDIKYIIDNNSSGKSTLYKFFHLKSEIEENESINVSDKLKSDLMTAGLSNLLSKINSNDIDSYKKHVVTKDYQINKKLVPESFVKNANYSQSNKELNEILKKILNLVVKKTNNKYLRDSSVFNMFIQSVKDNYSMIKTVRSLIDYNDIIMNATKQINVEKLLGIRHIFLDEAQDTSGKQWEFLLSIITEIFQNEESSLTIVGDEKQIIYEFNGSSKQLYDKNKIVLKEIVESFNGQWIEESLNKSYRSSKTLLTFIDNIMSQTKYSTNHEAGVEKFGYIKTWAPIKIVSSLDENQIQKWKVDSEQKIPEWITLCTNEIKRLKTTKLLNEDRLVQDSDITILIPKRCVNTFILCEELKKAGIKIKESPFYISQNDTIQELIAIGEIVLDPENDLMVVSLLKSAFFRWSNAEVEELCVDRQTSVWTKMLESTHEKTQAFVQEVQNWISFPKDILSFYSKLLFDTQYGNLMFELFYNEVLIFWEKAVEFSQKSCSLFEFISKMKSSPQNLVSNNKGVSICTIHSSKGRESNIVFLCNSNITTIRNSSLNLVYQDMLLLKGNYKLYKQIKSKNLFDQEVESDRLLYVALTRAKEQLYINPKSWYSKVIQNIDLFKINENDEYEIFSEIGKDCLTKNLKYN